MKPKRKPPAHDMPKKTTGQTKGPIAIGIDLGGTKSEVRLYDMKWETTHTRYDPTPSNYSDLLDMLESQICWAQKLAGKSIPIGLGTAGLMRADGIAKAANLPISNQHFTSDLRNRIGSNINILNDARAFTLSEAVFGAAADYETVMGIILGTGVGGGLVVNKKALTSEPSIAGEIGHIAAPAGKLYEKGFELRRCGCGKLGCYETLLSGPGLAHIATARFGYPITTFEFVAMRSHSHKAQKLWQDWCEIAAELLLTMVLIADPDCIVLGGGLSQIEGIEKDLAAALASVQFEGFGIPEIVLPSGGPTSGGRGAAFAAWQAQQDHV